MTDAPAQGQVAASPGPPPIAGSRDLALAFAGFQLATIIAAPFVHTRLQLAGLEAIAILGTSLLGFVWFRRDADRRGLKPGRAFRTGVAGFGGLFLPIHLLRTRGALRASGALALFLLYFLGILVVAIVLMTVLVAFGAVPAQG